jgi:ABC-type transport system involved in multi-copper enzyme maturation permease subunit
LGSSTLTEQRQMGLAYESEFARLILVLGLTTFICFHVRRMYDTREIEAILARPISRRVFVLAYYAAFSVVALLLCLILAPLMIGGLGAAGIGFAEWEASLMLECLILVAMSLFISMVLESATASVVAVLGFYALGRSAAFFLAIAGAGTGAGDQEGVNQGSNAIIAIVAAIMPRLDLFGQSRWLITGPGGGWGLGELLLQSAIYIPLLLLATIRDLEVKAF